jgi:two-component system response regulator YesN
MQEACRLLARPDLLIKEVAYRVGFEDANYFSRRFKSVVGTSPTAYRKNGPRGGPQNGPEDSPAKNA